MLRRSLSAGCLLSAAFWGHFAHAQSWEPTRPQQPVFQAPVQPAGGDTEATDRSASQVRFAGSTRRTHAEPLSSRAAPSRERQPRTVSASRAAYNQLMDSKPDSGPVQPLRWKSPKNASVARQVGHSDANTGFPAESEEQRPNASMAFAGGNRAEVFSQEPVEYSTADNSGQLAEENLAPVVAAPYAAQVAGPYESQIQMAAYQEGDIGLPLPPVTVPEQGGSNLSLPEVTLPPVDQEFDKQMGRAEPAPIPNMLEPKPEVDGAEGRSIAPLPESPGGSQDPRINPFGDDPAPSPADRQSGDALPAQQEELESPDPLGRAKLSCNERRARIQSRSIQDITLDISPSFGKGLHDTRTDAEQERLNFANTSPVRDWFNYKGEFVTSGRLIDLREDNVILDAQGSEERILLRDLSDEDLAYVGEAWHLPLDCGTGNPPFVGRDFTPTTYQWAAPGNCHKPLYFQQTQLERYGHSAGPVMQPILSTAHFFSNIAILPYRMGIHPPNECQYSLGYYRPGDCAPYMMEPLPISLRGMATQVTAMSGGAALIP